MQKLNRLYTLLEDFCSSLFLIVGFSLMFYEVVMRYVFNSPTTWINEVSTMCVVWGIFFGLSIALRDHHHISVDILYFKMPQKVQKFIDYFANIVGIAFCLFFTYNGIILVAHNISSHQVSVETGVPYWVYYIVIPIAGITFMIRFVERLWRVYSPSQQEEDNNGHFTAF